METSYEERFTTQMLNLAEQPVGKQNLILKVVQLMCESEAFIETYPRIFDSERAAMDSAYRTEATVQMAKIIARFLKKNRASIADANRVLVTAREIYGDMYSHSDKS